MSTASDNLFEPLQKILGVQEIDMFPDNPFSVFHCGVKVTRKNDILSLEVCVCCDFFEIFNMSRRRRLETEFHWK